MLPHIKDLGKSAWKGDHLRKGELGAFYKRILNDEIARDSVILVEHLDRISRQKASVTRQWMESVFRHGVKIATVTGDKIYDQQALDDNVLSLVEILFVNDGANKYAETLSKRVKSSYKERLIKARQDKTPVTTQGPAWLDWSVTEKRWIKNDNAKLVREIYDLCAAGHAPWSIATMFNDRGTKSFTGISWERTSIVKILRSPAVEGDKVVGEGKASKPTGEVIDGYYGDPTVPVEIVAQARAMLDRRSRQGKGNNSTQVNNLFGQKIRCGECGGRMMQTGWESRYLTCYEASRANKCTHKVSYKYRPFERAALDSILGLALDEKFFRQAEKSNNLSIEIDDLQKTISNKTAQAKYAFDESFNDPAGIAKLRYKEISAELVKLNAKLAELEVQMAQARGVASADEHLKRVHDVREALSHPDEDVRLPARLRVAEALAGVIDYVQAWSPQGEKRLLMVAIGGGHKALFDNDGNKLSERKPKKKTETLKDGTTIVEIEVQESELPDWMGKRLEPYLRRMADEK